MNTFYKIKKPLLLITIVAVAVILYLNYGHYLTWDSLNSNKESLNAFTQKNYLNAVIIFMFVYITVTALSIPGAVWMTLAGGFVFGTFPNLIFTNISATAGATIVFIVARYIMGDTIQKKYGDKLEKFNREIESNGFQYLLGLRLMPIFPFWMVNLLSGMTKIKTRTYLLCTMIGMIPGGFVYSYAGSQLNAINSPSDILSKEMFFALLMLGLLIIVPGLLKGIFMKKGRVQT